MKVYELKCAIAESVTPDILEYFNGMAPEPINELVILAQRYGVETAAVELESLVAHSRATESLVRSARRLVADYAGSGDTQPSQHTLRHLAGMVETTEVTIADISDVAGNSIAAAVRQILSEGEK